MDESLLLKSISIQFSLTPACLSIRTDAQQVNKSYHWAVSLSMIMSRVTRFCIGTRIDFANFPYLDISLFCRFSGCGRWPRPKHGDILASDTLHGERSGNSRQQAVPTGVRSHARRQLSIIFFTPSLQQHEHLLSSPFVENLHHFKYNFSIFMG